jgi:hypothetical protein
MVIGGLSVIPALVGQTLKNLRIRKGRSAPGNAVVQEQ